MSSQVQAESVLDPAAVESLRERFRGELITPDDSRYDEARMVFNTMVDRRPALIARCAGVADVIESVKFARAGGLLVSVRGGGHNVTGSAVCDGGLVIDLSGLKGLHIDPVARTIRGEPGLTWAEVNHDLQAFGLGASGGYVSTTGVSGLTLGGGLGWLARKHGLACDSLRSADLVTADGELVRASATENAELFWGLRGGGGNFGIVTSFEFDVHPVGVVLAGLIAHPVASAKDLLGLFRDFVETAPDELTSGVLLLSAPQAPFVPEPAWGTPLVAFGFVYAGSPESGEEVVRPMREFGTPLLEIVDAMPFSAAQVMADGLGGWSPGFQQYWKSSFLTGLPEGAIDTIVSHVATVPSPQTIVVVDHNGGGAIARVQPEETAFPHRNWTFNFLITSAWSESEDAEENIAWTRKFWDAMQPFTGDAVYVNYLGAEGEEGVRHAYGAATYERLAALKRKYDPENFFRLNQNISPAA